MQAIELRAMGLAIAGALLTGCGGELTPVLGCESGFGIEVDCQFQNPEDLALAPDGRILVSQYGDMTGDRAGNLAIYEPEGRSLTVLFPSPAAVELGQASSAREWGDPACAFPDPGTFAPHGIDLETRDDGRFQLAVVNHGGRESIELFEVFDDGALAWRGCVEGPQDSYFNDVVVLGSGGFWATHMFARDSGIVAFARSALGMDTGWVYAWSPGAGFSKLPGSDAPFPNGIEKSDDERYAYVNTYSSAGVRKIDVATGAIVAMREMASVDNSTWAADGRLLVASHTGSILQNLRCQGIEQGACGMPFEIVALDPDDLSEQVLIAHEGAPMGGVTVALEREGIIYLGTFAGDRIGIVDLSR